MNLDDIIKELAEYYDMEVKMDEDTHFIQEKDGETYPLKDSNIGQMVSSLFDEMNVNSLYNYEYEKDFIKCEGETVNFDNKQNFKFDTSLNDAYEQDIKVA